jgi:hypothetical protein
MSCPEKKGKKIIRICRKPKLCCFNHEGHEENKAVVNSLYAAFVIFVFFVVR